MNILLVIVILMVVSCIAGMFIQAKNNIIQK